MTSKAYLIIETKYPTIHKNEKEAMHYLQFIRDTDKFHSKLKAMICRCTDKDIREAFCNCVFKSI